MNREKKYKNKGRPHDISTIARTRWQILQEWLTIIIVGACKLYPRIVLALIWPLFCEIEKEWNSVFLKNECSKRRKIFRLWNIMWLRIGERKTKWNGMKINGGKLWLIISNLTSQKINGLWTSARITPKYDRLWTFAELKSNF